MVIRYLVGTVRLRALTEWDLRKLARAFYMDESNIWRLDLTETTSLGLAGFVEVSPGELTVARLFLCEPYGLRKTRRKQ